MINEKSNKIYTALGYTAFFANIIALATQYISAKSFEINLMLLLLYTSYRLITNVYAEIIPDRIQKNATILFVLLFMITLLVLFKDLGIITS